MKEPQMTIGKKTVEFDISIKADSEDGSFSAYGNVFNVVDGAKEMSIPGAFAESIKQYQLSGKMPKFLGQHGHKMNPIGIITKMVEDEKGLLFEGKFALKTQAGAEAYELCKMGALKEFSIGHIVKKDEYKNGVRELKEIDVKEISLVTFACNEESTLQSIKSALDSGEDPTLRQVQNLLRESGLSKREASAAVESIKSLSVEPIGLKEVFLFEQKNHVRFEDPELEVKAADMSMNDYMEMIVNAVYNSFRASVDDTTTWYYCEAVYIDCVILRVCEETEESYNRYFVRIPYSVTEDHDVMVGSATVVERIVKWVSEEEKQKMGIKETDTQPLDVKSWFDAETPDPKPETIKTEIESWFEQ